MKMFDIIFLKNSQPKLMLAVSHKMHLPDFTIQIVENHVKKRCDYSNGLQTTKNNGTPALQSFELLCKVASLHTRKVVLLLSYS